MFIVYVILFWRVHIYSNFRFFHYWPDIFLTHFLPLWEHIFIKILQWWFSISKRSTNQEMSWWQIFIFPSVILKWAERARVLSRFRRVEVSAKFLTWNSPKIVLKTCFSDFSTCFLYPIKVRWIRRGLKIRCTLHLIYSFLLLYHLCY